MCSTACGGRPCARHSEETWAAPPAAACHPLPGLSLAPRGPQQPSSSLAACFLSFPPSSPLWLSLSCQWGLSPLSCSPFLPRDLSFALWGNHTGFLLAGQSVWSVGQSGASTPPVSLSLPDMAPPEDVVKPWRAFSASVWFY